MLNVLQTYIHSNLIWFKSKLRFFDLSFVFLLIIASVYYYYSETLFFGFVSGNLYCILVEISLFCRYLLTRFQNRRESYNISLFLSILLYCI